jgi:hypothetical protein
VLDPGREYDIRVKDAAGYVAEGRLTFKADLKTLSRYCGTLVCLGLALALWLVAPVLQGLLPSPPGPASLVVEAENLCR